MRKLSIDLVRGLVIVLMALDHTQYFWHMGGLPEDGLDGFVPRYASTFHQLTRALSHICAPTFLFLAGMMMVGSRSKKHFLIRGAILIFLQFTLENIAWWPKNYLTLGYNYFGILSCIGVSMCILALLSGLRPIYILLLSLGVFLLSPLDHPGVPKVHPALQALAIIFYVPTLVRTYPMTSLFPVFPWVGFMALGYWFGLKSASAGLFPYRNKLLSLSALLVSSAFIIRYVNGFGNLIHWQGRPFGSDFFILSKYPPSLVYILLTLGILFLLLSVALHCESRLRENLAHPFLNTLNIFGQSALFFYVVHLYVYGAGAYILGRNVQLSLEGTWGIWLLGLVPLYYLCVYYKKLKANYSDSWLKYI